MSDASEDAENRRHSIIVELTGAEYRYIALVALRTGGSPERAVRVLIRTAMGLHALSVSMFGAEPERSVDVDEPAQSLPDAPAAPKARSKWAKRYAILGVIASFVGLLVAMLYIMWK